MILLSLRNDSISLNLNIVKPFQGKHNKKDPLLPTGQVPNYYYNDSAAVSSGREASSIISGGGAMISSIEAPASTLV